MSSFIIFGISAMIKILWNLKCVSFQVHETIRDTDTELQSEGATAEPPSRETRPVAPSAKRAREDDRSVQWKNKVDK